MGLRVLKSETEGLTGVSRANGRTPVPMLEVAYRWKLIQLGASGDQVDA